MRSTSRLRIAVVLILAFSLISGKALAEEVELKYDDGSMEFLGSMGDYYHVVKFSPPSTPWLINKLKIYGKGYEAFTGKEYKIQIWDKDFKILYDEPWSDGFTNIDKWVTFDIAKWKVNVTGDFYIAFSGGYSRDYGFYVGIDNSSINNNSYIFSSLGKEVKDWYSLGYWFGQRRKTANWMIRVVGSTPSIKIPTIPEKELLISNMEDISLWSIWKGDENDIVILEKDSKYSKEGNALKVEYKFDGKGDNWGSAAHQIGITIPEVYSRLEFWSYVPEPEKSGQIRVRLHEPNRVRYYYVFRTPSDKGCIQHSIPLSEFFWEKDSNEDPNKKLDIEKITEVEFNSYPNSFVLYIDDVKFAVQNESSPQEIKTPVECRFPLPTVPLLSLAQPLVDSEKRLLIFSDKRIHTVKFKMSNITEIKYVEVIIDGRVTPPGYNEKADGYDMLEVRLNGELPVSGEFGLPDIVKQAVEKENPSWLETTGQKVLWYAPSELKGSLGAKGTRTVRFSKAALVEGENILVLESGDRGDRERHGDGIFLDGYTIKAIPVGAVSTAQTPVETPAPSKGICGPTAMALIALLPLVSFGLLKKRYRRLETSIPELHK